MEFQIKLGGEESRGTSLTTKATQGQLMALAHNLRWIDEARLERTHGVSNAGEVQRRQERHREMKQAARPAGGQFPTLRTGLRRARMNSPSFKSLRWLQSSTQRLGFLRAGLAVATH